MKRLTKRCLQAGIFIGGVWVLGSGIAAAEGTNHPAQHGTTLRIPVTAPVTPSNAPTLSGTPTTSTTPASTGPATPGG